MEGGGLSRERKDEKRRLDGYDMIKDQS